MQDQNQKNNDDMSKLRIKAEEQAKGREIRSRGMSETEISTLFHELEVHQIELELQNEELRRIHNEVRVSMERYAELFEFAPVGYFILDAQFTITESNLTASRIMGSERSRLAGQRVTHFIFTEYQDMFYKWIKSDDVLILEKGLELTMRRSDGARFFAELKAVRESRLDSYGRYRLAVADVSERKKMEDDLRQSHEEMEQRVRERTDELSETVTMLYERTRQLRRITGQLAVAEQRERQRLAQILHDGLQQILVAAKYKLALLDREPAMRDSADQVSVLIDDAIKTSRSLTSELSPPVLLHGDFSSGLEWLVRWMRDMQGLEVKLSIGSGIRPIDTEATLLLFQAARELLFNVVKHSGVKTAQVNLDQSEDQVILEVEDHGAGFDRSRLKQSSGLQSGIGLLGIEERISYIGGRMDVKSSPGKGSCFRLIMPVSIYAEGNETSEDGKQKKMPDMAVPEPGSEGKEAKKIRILLVDDHEVMRQGLAGLLAGEPDFDVIAEAADGETAVKLAREIHPDVVLMDISMPGMDGIQATRIIHREIPDIRIIGLSMFQEPEREKTMRDAGADAYLTKSGPSENVVTTVRSLANGK